MANAQLAAAAISDTAALLAAAGNARTDMQRLIAAERGELVCDELERIERHDEWEGGW